MNRRFVLAGLPVAAVALAQPTRAAEGETEILRIFREIESIDERAAVHETGFDGEAEDRELERLFYSRRDKLLAKMMELPSTCAADFAAKTIADTCKGNFVSEWNTGILWKEARALVGM